jgi:WD40 repeat protein/Flp pilus assembly protein TadD
MGVVVSSFYAARLQKELTRTAEAEHRVQEELTRTAEAEQQARQRGLEALDALVTQAHATRISHRPGRRFDALGALHKAATSGRTLGQPPEWFDALRNEAIAALALSDIHITHSWNLPTAGHWPELSDEFDLYAYSSDKGTCSIRRVADDVEVARLPELGEVAEVRFGTGRLLVLRGATSGQCQLWDLSGSKPILRLDQHHAVHSSHLRPDGRWLLLGHEDGSLTVHATDTGTCVYNLSASGNPGKLSARLHPSESIVAFCNPANVLQVRDLRTGAVLVTQPIPGDERGISNCAWSPDGHTLAVSRSTSPLVQLYAFGPVAPYLRFTQTLVSPDRNADVLFNPAGDRVVARALHGKVHLFDSGTGRLLFSTDNVSWTAGPFYLFVGPQLHFDTSGTRLSGALRLREGSIWGPLGPPYGIWSVADAHEYRALVHSRSKRHIHTKQALSLHPGGRLVARGADDGIALFDLETGRELAFVPVATGVRSVCFDGAGNLLTSSRAGLLRWPVCPDPVEPNHLTVGPVEQLTFLAGDRSILVNERCSVATSREGGVIAHTEFSSPKMPVDDGGWVLLGSGHPTRRVETAWCSGASVSPDGRWVAFSLAGLTVNASETDYTILLKGWQDHPPCINIYEVATGRRAWQSPTGESFSRFSSDGRWLLTDTDGGRVYSTGSWEPGSRLGAGTPWDTSPDGRLAVLTLAEGIYRLVDLATGRELARLEDPERIAGAACFSPDGSRLVVAAEDGLRIWDLRRIRRELARLGLDWDAPPYTEAAQSQFGLLNVQIVGPAPGDASSVAEYVRARAILSLSRNLFDAEAHYQLGRYLLDAQQSGQAYVHLSMALAFRSDHEAARFLRARAAFLLERWADAATDASNYLDRHALNHDLRSCRARSYRMAGRLEEAIRDWTVLLSHVPGSAKLYAVRAACQDALGHAEPAKADREKARALTRGDPSGVNDLAWSLVTGPLGERDPVWALQLIREAVQEQPQNAFRLNTLGVVQYRNGQYVQAIATLEKALNANRGQSDAFNLFFLAMCHAKLGAPAKAQACFEQALQWWNGKKNLSFQYIDDLKAFMAEAQATLNGLQPPPTQ